MRRKLLFLIILCMFAISARLELLNLHQQRIDANEHFHLLRSAEIALKTPLTGTLTWEDMLSY